MKRCRVFGAFLAVVFSAVSLWAQGVRVNGEFYEDLAGALAGIADPGDYDVRLYADQGLAPYVVAAGVRLSVGSGDGGSYRVSLASNGSLFTVRGGAELTLEDGVALVGKSGNNAPVVFVSGGSLFTMNGGAITGNSVPSTITGALRAGGVGIDNNGVFTMTGGEITENTILGTGGSVGGAGGVFAYGVGSVFNMSGGSITWNVNGVISASMGNGAGGVYISDGTMNMSGGTISDNSQIGELARAGGGVYLAYAARLNMTGGVIRDNKSQPSPNGNGDGVFVITTARVYFSNIPVIEDGIYTGGTLLSTLNIDGPFLPGALITVQGSGGSAMEPNVNVSSYGELTEEMANAFVSKDRTLVGTRSGAGGTGTRVVWAKNFAIWPDIDSISFGSTQYGYAELTPRAVVIRNENRATGLLEITLSGPNADVFELSKTSIDNIEVNQSDTFEVRPKTGLPVGSYGATVAIIGNHDNEAADIELTFTVTKASMIVMAMSTITVYGEEAPEFEPYYRGFVNGDDVSKLDGELTFTCAYAPGSDAGDYDIMPGGLTSENYYIVYYEGLLTVERRGALIRASVANKVYDGETNATVTNSYIFNKYEGDDAAVVAGTAVFNNKNVGNGKAVTFDGWSIGGVSADNYILVRQPSAAASITPKEITVGVGAIDYDGKVYDGTTAVEGLIMLTPAAESGIIEGDRVGVAFETAEFDSKNAGTRSVIVSGLTLRGADAENYTLLNDTVIKDNVLIEKRELTFKLNNMLVTVGDPLDPDGFTYSVTGLAESDEGIEIEFSVDAGHVDVSTPGVYDVTPAVTSALENYNVTVIGATVTVSGKGDVTGRIGAGSADFVYNGAPQAPEITFNGSASDRFSYHYVGTTAGGETYESTTTPPAAAGNYVVEAMYENDDEIGKKSFSFSIAPKPLTVVSAAHSKVYDGARNAARVSVTLGGIIDGDDVVSPAVATAMYASSNAGTVNATVTVLNLSGADASNYTAPISAGITVEGIRRKPITAAMFSVSPQNHTGSPLAPTPAASDGGLNVTFTAEYENNVNPGIAAITITGTGNYIGTVTITFPIIHAHGIGSVSVNDWVYGNEPASPAARSITNDTSGVIFEYKPSGASDGAYTTAVPVNAGNYIVRATFPQSDFYDELAVTSEFTIFKATRDRPYIPGIEELDPGSTPDHVPGLAQDVPRIPYDVSGLCVEVTASSVRFLSGTVGGACEGRDANWEYSLDGGGNWLSGGAFNDLERNSEYIILIRVKEDDNHFASDMAAILVRTLTEHYYDAAIDVPIVIGNDNGETPLPRAQIIKLEKSVVSGNAVFTLDAHWMTSANVLIYDKLGKVVFKMSNVGNGEKITWDLNAAGGRAVASGTYLIVAVAKDGNGKAQKHTAKLGVRRY